MKISVKFKEYFLLFILLFFSGNPLAQYLFGKYNIIAGLTITIIIFWKPILETNFNLQFKSLPKIITALALVFLCQYF
jgi:hypothetical protein